MKNVDLVCYMGIWYVIGYVLYFVEKGDVVIVDEYCFKFDGIIVVIYCYCKGFDVLEKIWNGKAWLFDLVYIVYWKV